MGEAEGTFAPERREEPARREEAPATAAETQIPQPFDSRPLEPGAGCRRWALIGCGGLLLLVGLAAVVFVVKADDIAIWFFQNVFEPQIEARLPDDLPPEDRARLEQAFTSFYAALREGTVEPQAMNELQGEIVQLSGGSAEPLTRDEVIELVEALEAAAGVESGDAPRAPPGG